MSGEQDEQRVTYSVKELLNRIDGKLDAMALTIAAKAEAVVVERLLARVETLEAIGQSDKQIRELYLQEYNHVKADVRRLNENAVSQESVRRDRKWLLATALTALTSLGGVVAIVFKFVH